MRGHLCTWIAAAFMMFAPQLVLAGNQELAQEIASTLKNSGQLKGYKIGVRCQDGTVWLRGTVADPEQRAIAERLTRQVQGVKTVINELSVENAAPADQLNLQPVTGAVAPERVTSPIGGLEGGARPMATPALAGKVQKADPVPSVVANQPVRPTAATAVSEGPTFAAPEIPTLEPPVEARPASATEATESVPRPIRPLPIAYAQAQEPTPAVPATQAPPAAAPLGRPLPMYVGQAGAAAPARYDQPNMPNYAWPSYAAYPNYAAVTYPKQYSPTAWPYIGPFYPYPQVPLGWRKVTLEWHDGWWFLDFDDGSTKGPFSGLFRAITGH
ncbi:BON domain-containing protein [Thermogutta sp.]|uniref:BON domain-containing protein n=1 Tax=Thermogutta sp. TaxID=1962930 RepID=UPI0032204554